MEPIRTMLESEIAASQKFTTRNFGLMMGDGFRELVEEVLASETVDSILLGNMLTMTLATRGFANDLRGLKSREDMKEQILAHFEVFRPQMEFLYWGIQIGRKLCAQESTALRTMENQTKE